MGLNGRYYSNACNSNQPGTDRDRITPHVATIDGNGATITVGTEGTAYGASNTPTTTIRSRAWVVYSAP